MKPVAQSSLRDLFSHQPFLRFWLARLAGILATQMLMVALAWHMYEITGSAWDLGLVGLFQFVPALILTLPAGQIVDRVHKVHIYAACMLIQAAVAGLLVWGTAADQVTRELVLFISAVLGMVRAFQMPTQQALTPHLVPSHLLQRAVALSSTGVQTAVIGGPALGGILYAMHVNAVYATCAAFLFIAFLLALSVRYEHKPSQAAADLRSVLAGAHFVWHHKVLLGAIALDLFAVLLGGVTALLPIYAKDILHTGPEGLGLLRSSPAVGALFMAAVLTQWPIERRVGPWMLMAVAVFGMANFVFGISTHFALSMLALMVAGAADNVSVVTRLTLLQLETPEDMRGRVAAVNSIFIGASNQLGEFESGATAAMWGPVGSVVFGGLATVGVALAAVKIFPSLAKRDHMVLPK
ncbi:MAG: Enterobactin exporter EntS [Pseudomonadota bacterium]|jgi:MFS family permease